MIAAIYGWLYWKYGGKQKERNNLPITHTPLSLYTPLLCTFAISFLGIAWILINFTNSNVPWLDSFTTALSIVGMWMLAKKYLEQWLTWIIVDIVSTGLYVYKEIYFTAGLYFIYTIIAVLGYRKWKNIMQHEQQQKTCSSRS